MKKLIPLSLVVLLAFTFSSKLSACSPVQTPFWELLENFEPKQNTIVQGYYEKMAGKNYSSSFIVTKTSDPQIKVGNAYKVYEYGPFGSSCEMYEMEANAGNEYFGKNHERLLILYKDRSKNGKLVTPIFWEIGVDAGHNKIVTKEYDHNKRDYVLRECLTKLDTLWKMIKKGTTKGLKWKTV